MVSTFVVALVSIVAGGFFLYSVFKKKKPRAAATSADWDRRKNSTQPKTVDEILDASLRDDVTGLYNIKHLLSKIKENMERSEREKDPFGLVLWDIDGFVQFNNRFGQEKGNVFLNKVADVIRKSLRSYDEAFRIGNDEFCAILTSGNKKIAADVIDRVSVSVSEHLFEGDGEYAGHSFSISSGVVFYPHEQKVPEGLLYEARQMLFKNHKSKAGS